jgi:hypothetical protein
VIVVTTASFMIPKIGIMLLYSGCLKFKMVKKVWAYGVAKNVDHVRDKFSNDTDILQSTLCIGNTHDAVEETYWAQLPRMIIPILTARKSVKIEINPDPTVMWLWSTYCQATPSKNGSAFLVSIAQ